MLKSYFLSLSCWTCLTNVVSFFLSTKPLHFTGLLHNVSSVYFLNNNMHPMAIVNTLGYYTNDIMNIVYTKYYTYSERVVYSFHHMVSIFFLMMTNPDTYYLTVTIFRDLEFSNLALFGYYYLSKLTNDPVLLAVANTIEALVYGYYRLGLIYYFVHYYSVIKEYYIHQVLFVGLYSFGVYFTYVLSNFAINKVINLYKRLE